MMGLLALFTGLVAAVGLMPHGDSPIRELMTGVESCAAPCWQGIRPGVTTFREAVDLLAANTRIVRLDQRQRYHGESVRVWYVRWAWQGSSGAEVTGTLMIQDGIVRVIRIDSLIPFGQVWEALGQPDQGTYVGTLIFTDSAPRTVPLYHTAIYSRSGITLQTNASCGDFWWQPSMLTFSDTPEAGRAYDVARYRRYSCEGWSSEW
jgi:hypothetical protein